MASYGSRRGPNVSQYIANLNTVDDSSPIENLLGGDDLSLFATTDFFDFDMGNEGLGGLPPASEFDHRAAARKSTAADWQESKSDFMNSMCNPFSSCIYSLYIYSLILSRSHFLLAISLSCPEPELGNHSELHSPTPLYTAYVLDSAVSAQPSIGTPFFIIGRQSRFPSNSCTNCLALRGVCAYMGRTPHAHIPAHPPRVTQNIFKSCAVLSRTTSNYTALHYGD
ncbi:hypothetical protein EJ08DRAFT_214622 [Tothia fuscella]|uniref:Uncharacterized protein n=1 Tax=Tothia fuscella TaxID=1048955 RepID=A0A9P4NS50_9PEZI|nr:hypothetical protein EJ08DRAFT_214622 [Tothia fuscella]